MKTKIFLIRHADAHSRDTEFQDDAAPLSELGKKQAQALAKRLKGEKIAVLYVSPFRRTRETAEILRSEIETPVFEEEGLEELHWGKWLGIKYRHFHYEVPDWTAQILLHEEKRLKRMQKRPLRLLDKIFHQNEGKNIAVLTHGNIIRAILTAVLDAGVRGFLSLEVALTGISRLDIDEKGNIKVVYINDFSHLAPVA